jgi:6-phosphogluconolactonase
LTCYLNKQLTLGSITAYSAVSPDGKFLLVANYGMGEGGLVRLIVVFPIGNDGSLGLLVSGVRHEGIGLDAGR